MLKKTIYAVTLHCYLKQIVTLNDFYQPFVDKTQQPIVS